MKQKEKGKGGHMTDICYPQVAFTAIIKPVSAGCNLRCRYCFYFGQQGEIKRMPYGTLEVVIKECLAATSHSVRFIWHGGEPLLSGIPFYQCALELEEKHRYPNQLIQNSIQTNAILLNEEWLKFLSANNFRIGISLDGPEELHNFARVDAAGKGTFHEVMRAIDRMRSLGIRFGVITVINSHNVNYPEQIYQFFQSQRLSFSPNICLDGGDLSTDPIRYAEFMMKIFDLWIKEDDPRMRIRPLVNVVQGVFKLSPRYAKIGVEPELCRFQGMCHKYLTIDFNGDVFPCDKFIEERFRLGNLFEAPLSEISSSVKYQDFFGQRVEVTKLCDGCEWLQACQGGCMREWDINTDGTSYPNTRYCEGRKILFDHVRRNLKEKGNL